MRVVCCLSVWLSLSAIFPFGDLMAMPEKDAQAPNLSAREMDRRASFKASGAALATGAALSGGCVTGGVKGAEKPLSLATRPVHASPEQSNDGVVYERFSSDLMKSPKGKFPLIPEDRRVTRDNFLVSTVDHLRWAHRHGHNILYKSHLIERGKSPVRVLRYKAADPEKVNRLELTVENGRKVSVANWLKETNADEIIAMHEDQIIFHKCFGEQRPSDPHWVWSMTKSFLAMVASNVTEDRTLLDEHAPVTRYVPEYAATGYSEATFAQIMNMQAGIRYRYTPDDPNADPKASQMGTPEYRRASFEDARHYRANGIVRKLENEPEAFGINDFLLTLKERDRKDGSVLYYGDINSPAAALVLERVTNRSFPDLLRQYWGNLGAESNAYLLHDAQGTALANSGLFATGRDLARAAYAILNNGSVGNRQLFSERFSEKLKTLPSRDKFNPQSNLWGSLPAGLAYHNFTVALPTPSGTQVLGGGAFGQWFLVDFARRNVLVKLSSDLFVTSEKNKMDIFALQSLSDALPLLQ